MLKADTECRRWPLSKLCKRCLECVRTRQDSQLKRKKNDVLGMWLSGAVLRQHAQKTKPKTRQQSHSEPVDEFPSTAYLAIGLFWVNHTFKQSLDLQGNLRLSLDNPTPSLWVDGRNTRANNATSG